MTKKQGASRNNNFGTLHLLAAIFVLYGHQCALLNQATPFVLGSQIQAVGVKIIFLISGYLIVKSLLTEEVSSLSLCKIFVIKRLGRLYPEYIFCLSITAVVVGPLFSELSLFEYLGNDTWWNYILSNVRVFPSYNLSGVFLDNPYPGAVNGSLWTMPVELFMYGVLLAFGLFCRKLKMRNRIYALLTTVVIILFIIRFSYYPNTRYVLYGTDWMAALNVLPYILVGGLFYVFDFRKILNVQVALFVFLFANMFIGNSQSVNELISVLVLPYIIFSLGLSDEQQLKLRVLKGEYAYGIYLWGFVVQQSVIQIFVVRLGLLKSVGLLFIISAVVTYIIAAFSYEIIYTPFSRIIRKWVSRIKSRNTDTIM